MTLDNVDLIEEKALTARIYIHESARTLANNEFNDSTSAGSAVGKAM